MYSHIGALDSLDWTLNLCIDTKMEKKLLFPLFVMFCKEEKPQRPWNSLVYYYINKRFSVYISQNQYYTQTFFVLQNVCKYKTRTTQKMVPQYSMLILFALMLYIQVNNFSIISGQFPVFLGWTGTKQQTKCLVQGHNTMTPVCLELATLQSPV